MISPLLGKLLWITIYQNYYTKYYIHGNMCELQAAILLKLSQLQVFTMLFIPSNLKTSNVTNVVGYIPI